MIRALSSCHKNCYFSPANLSIATKHSLEGPQKGLHPECPQGHGQGQRSRNSGTFRALLSCHENRLFSRTNCSITNKLALNVPRAGRHPGSAQGQGRGQRSRDTGTFVLSQKLLLLTGKWLDCHQTFTQRSPEGPAPRMSSRSRSMSKVT